MKWVKTKKVEFSEESVKKYLDEAIENWRKKSEGAEGEDALIANCYIDAYQSMRTSLFGETKEKKEEKKEKENEEEKEEKE